MINFLDFKVTKYGNAAIISKMQPMQSFIPPFFLKKGGN